MVGRSVVRGGLHLAGNNLPAVGCQHWASPAHCQAELHIRPVQPNQRRPLQVCGPGSGKGSQCDKIVRDFGYLHLSRDEVKNGTEIGQECEQLMKDGKLVPVEVTLKLIKKAMKESKDVATGFLMQWKPS